QTSSPFRRGWAIASGVMIFSNHGIRETPSRYEDRHASNSALSSDRGAFKKGDNAPLGFPSIPFMRWLPQRMLSKGLLGSGSQSLVISVRNNEAHAVSLEEPNSHSRRIGDRWAAIAS